LEDNTNRLGFLGYFRRMGPERMKKRKERKERRRDAILGL
jgi:hypothetical protein